MKINTRRTGQRMGGVSRFPYGPYGDAGGDIVKLFTNISPWEAITSGFKAGAQSSQDKAEQARAASMTAQTKSATAVEITKYIAMGAAAFIGGLVLITVVKRPKT